MQVPKSYRNKGLRHEKENWNRIFISGAFMWLQTVRQGRYDGDYAGAGGGKTGKGRRESGVVHRAFHRRGYGAGDGSHRTCESPYKGKRGLSVRICGRNRIDD